MTLTELRYLVALAEEENFSHAAERCAVSQPTLSVAIARLEDELGVLLFERGKNFVGVSAVGKEVVAQAARTLEEAEKIHALARAGRNQLQGVLRLGLIHTISPYLLPQLVKSLHALAPEMPLVIEENMTANLLAMLRNNELDALILALPLVQKGIVARPLYDEAFKAIVPAGHPLASRREIHPDDLPDGEMLLLKAGNCFRDQVLEACPQLSRPEDNARLGQSIETIRAMVASGLGISVLPESALAAPHDSALTRAISFAEPTPFRRIALAWRVGFIRPRAIDALIEAIQGIDQPCYRRIGN
ncbi:MAG: hydrogen peroxide-inducible genes activator [Betaproteobacteria bacterium]|nr:hydrogen peroxide-inducible genes activator [Betaproteobacteria bacterium]